MLTRIGTIQYKIHATGWYSIWHILGVYYVDIGKFENVMTDEFEFCFLQLCVLE